MLIPNGTKVLVVDGSKMLLLENCGEARSPKLEVLLEDAQDLAPDRELSADRPGRAHSSAGLGRSAYQQTDFHEQAEDRFAMQAATYLNEMCPDDGIIVIAPPRTLGKLRRRYCSEVQEKVLVEIGKDLTGHPVQQIAKLIAAYHE